MSEGKSSDAESELNLEQEPSTTTELPYHPGPPSKTARDLVVGGAIGFFVLALIGDTMLSQIVDRHPALFIALNSRNRNLALAKSNLDWWSFFGIATVRLMISDPLFFLLGRWYGDAGGRWIEERSATYGPMISTLERWFSKASYPLVAFMPNQLICWFAGSNGMAVPVFFALNLTGTVVRLTLLWLISGALSDPLDVVRDFIASYRLQVLAFSIFMLVLTSWMDRRSGGGQISSLMNLDAEAADAKIESETPSEP